MAEFVHWDKAEQPVPSTGTAANASLGDPRVNLDFQPVGDNHDFDLALANIDGDDFSFWALEHFETSNLDLGISPPANGALTTPSTPAFPFIGEGEAPCDACDASGFNCKRIKDGDSKGSCTTCVTLNISCSFIAALANPLPPCQPGLRCNSSPELTKITSPTIAAEDNSSPNNVAAPTAPKVGARFSRESVRILKAWLSTHSHRPYPTDEERENLQRQTGLNKTQIANWLANARRRSKGKFQQRTRSTSPSVRGWSGAMEIPARKGTPAFGDTAEYLSPLQRWQNSPPENEPASVTAIASAILQSNDPFDSGLNSPFTLTDDDAARSCKESVASSFGTSPSSGSFASAWSHGSRGSFSSLQQRGRRRRRRRTAPKETSEGSFLNAPLKMFQCTFCTETFRTKHDWQRHEKSLHLSLERWVCCPQGPLALHPDTNQPSCVFCGATNPDASHTESHNYVSCQERALAERTFYRKDHLRQHLKLVHNAKYVTWSMDAWKVPTPDIRSRCGFCNASLTNWPARVNHLAEHFKAGDDMRTWKGDWGFEPSVLSMVENAIPPFMIQDERTTPLPFQASRSVTASPRSAYELIKLELAYYNQNKRDTTGITPSDDELQHEACRIIYASEALSEHPIAAQSSWLRDLLTSSNELSLGAQLGPMRTQAEWCLSKLSINGKANIFEECLLEKQLTEFVQARNILDLPVSNDELQVETCNILGRSEECSSFPSEQIANFLLRLIHKDCAWLASFRQRASLPPAGESAAVFMDKGKTIHNYSQLERELAEYSRNYHATTLTNPSDEQLRKHARGVVYKCNPNIWEKTAADNDEWLTGFKTRHFAASQPSPLSDNNSNKSSSNLISPNLNPSVRRSNPSSLFPNGASFYRHVTKELSRFVAVTMSPNNPNQHVPSDEELQHQARWVLYDDDDPFHKTPADNPEWLLGFKRAMGLIPSTDAEENQAWSSAIPTQPDQWQGTAAPEPFHNTPPVPEPMQIDSGEIGLVFTNRTFEDRLVQFAVAEVATSGKLPVDEAIQARAKELSGLEVWEATATPVDDPVLLEKFKAMVVERVKAVLGGFNDQNSMRTSQEPPSRSASSMAARNGIRKKSPLSNAPDRGMDAIDPGLLPALEPELGAGANENEVQVAISESRLDEIITEALG